MPPGKLRRSPRNARTAPYHPLKPREGPCVIESLPPEILRDIYTLNFDDWVVPIALFLVNRRWNEVASGHSLLRSVIHIGPAEEYHRNCTEYEKPVFCTSSFQLTRALARIGNARFTLYITWIPDDIVLRNYPLEDRCRELHLNIYNPYSSPLELEFPEFPKLSALEELNIGDSGCPDFLLEDKTEELLDDLELSATPLKALRLYGSWLPMLPYRSKLLGGLRDLHLLTDGTLIKWKEIELLLEGMKNLALLVWEQVLLVPCPINSIPDSVTTLYLLGVPEIRLQAARTLVNLTVAYARLYEERRVPADSVLHLPSLKSLELRGSWLDLPRIRAPTLNLLSLSKTYEGSARLETVVPLIQVKTKVLYINSLISDYGFKSLLNGVWSDLEELHWICPDQQPLATSLERGLTGGPKTRPLCPKLNVLTIEVISTEEANPNVFRQCVRRLGNIVEGRRNGACNSLVTVRCGWRDTEMLDDGEDDSDAVMTWLNVL